MQRYANNITTQSGQAVPGAIVTVLNYPSLTSATIYSTNDGAAQANPLITDNLGFFAFYAADGRYSLSISGRGIKQYQIDDILLEDQLALDSFTQTGAGAVPRPILKKIGDEPSTPQDFGAKGDGVTDDTVALQAWLNALALGDKGECVPGSVYGFTNITLPNAASYTGSGSYPARNWAIVIDGRGATLKKIAAGSDATYGIAAAQWVGNVNAVNSPIRICDLNVDLNGLATTAGIITQHWNSLFERVNVFNAAGHGWMQTGKTLGGTTITSTLNNNNWVACDLYNNGGHGLYVSSPTGSNNTDGILDRVRAFDNVLANVNAEACAGWEFKSLHCYNYRVTQTDLGVTKFGFTNATRWVGCEFDNDANNTAKPSAYVVGGTQSNAGSFDGCYFYSPLTINNSQSYRVAYSLSGCQFLNTGYLYLASANLTVTSSGGIYQIANPFQSAVNVTSTSASFVISANDFWTTNKVRLHGQHQLTKGASAPYTGGYCYEPIKGHAYNVAASGATYPLTYADSSLQIFTAALTAAITIQLPPKANMSDFQRPFEFQRYSTATGAFNIVIVDVDTGFTIAQLTTAGTYQKIIFDGAAWKVGGSGTL
jgi:hypothetical protein